MPAVEVHFRDFGGEVVTTGIPTKVTATAPQRAALVDAFQLWSIGENDGADYVSEIEARIGNGANSPQAQSGIYAYVVMRDNVNGRSYKERLPMPDLGKAVDGDGDSAWLPEVDASGNTISVMNLAHTDAETLKTALEDAYVSPNGNTATMTRVYVPNRL